MRAPFPARLLGGRRRWRPLLIALVALATLYLLLPPVLAAWLPKALAPYGFGEVRLSLRLPGWRELAAETLSFTWAGPDGLRLRFSARDARYRYREDRWEAGAAELEILAWPLEDEADATSQPLSAWPLLPVRELGIERLRLHLPVLAQRKTGEGRLKAQIQPDGTAQLVLYMAQGLPDGLPGRFELRLSPAGRLSATAGLARGKTTVLFAETHLQAPPAAGPAFRLRLAGDLRPIYRWLARSVPQQAQIQGEFSGRLPRRYDASGWFEDLEARGQAAVRARQWQLPWGLAQAVDAKATLDYRHGGGHLVLASEQAGSAGLILPAFKLDSRFERKHDAIEAQGRLDSKPISARFRLGYEPKAGRGRLTLEQWAGSYQALSWRGGELQARLEALASLRLSGDWRLGELDLAAGFALSDFQGRAQWARGEAGPVLAAEAISALGLGGRLVIDRLHWSPGQALRLPLTVENLDLAALLALIREPALSGEGRVSGTLPLRWQDGRASLEAGAELRSERPGNLRYRPPGGERTDNVGLKALQDFHYRRLALALSYAESGDYGLRLQLEGANPRLYNGYPIAFNLNLDGRLPELLQAALVSGDFAGHLLKDLREQAQPVAQPRP